MPTSIDGAEQRSASRIALDTRKVPPRAKRAKPAQFDKPTVGERFGDRIKEYFDDFRRDGSVAIDCKMINQLAT